MNRKHIAPTHNNQFANATKGHIFGPQNSYFVNVKHVVHVVTTVLEELSLIWNSTVCVHVTRDAKFRPTNKHFEHSGIVVGCPRRCSNFKLLHITSRSQNHVKTTMKQ
jgi:hypothetical protein